MAAKSYAAADEPPIEVLLALQSRFDLLDFAGPVEVLTAALHNDNKSNKAFEITLASAESKVLSEQNIIISSQVLWKEAHERLSDFDVLIVVGGGSEAVLKTKAEPLPLINAFADLQKADPSRERSLMSVCTGSLFLAESGVLSGLSATTHPDYMTAFENLCSHAATRNLTERTDVVEDARYIVNNLRFEIGEEEENPYIYRKTDVGRHPSNGRKGSVSFHQATRRESIARRAAMRLGGLRVITSGGPASGLDAALYLVSALVSQESTAAVASKLQLTWTKGIVVDGIDV